MITYAEHVRSPAPTLLLGVAADPQQAVRVLAEGADLIDASAASPQARAAIGAGPAGSALWTGLPADPVDADEIAARASGSAGLPLDSLVAAVVAVAAISTWLGAPVIRTRHTSAARRAIDMTESIAGTRPPSLTVRGLA